jgi:hypothetical protein
VNAFILPKNARPDRDRIAGNLARFLDLLPDDRAWKVEVSEHRKRRSDQQNRYLFGVCYPVLLAHLPGWDKDDLHEYMLGEWAGWERLEGMGRVRMKPIKRSSKLSTVEFGEFVDFVQRKAAELGLYVPSPGEFAEAA